MYLKQTDRDVILFGTDERRHILEMKGPQRFRAEDIDAAAQDLLAAYPGEAAAIARYADRLRTMLARPLA